MDASPTVLAVASKATHKFSKDIQPAITLVAGFGVSGDAHYGTTVQHRYDKKRNPDAPNLRQVHLMSGELFEWLSGKGYSVGPGELGENITTSGLDILTLPEGTRLHLGADAVIELTGLREPCRLINSLGQDLMEVLKDCDTAGNLRRKAGVMSIVITGGEVRAGDVITVTLPDGPHKPMRTV